MKSVKGGDEKIRYDAWGGFLEKYERTGHIEEYSKRGVLLGYNGKPFDSFTELYNYGYRHLDTDSKQWLTQDPIRDGSNWHAYLGGVSDPVNYVDLWGLCASDSEAARAEQSANTMDLYSTAMQGIGSGLKYAANVSSNYITSSTGYSLAVRSFSKGEEVIASVIRTPAVQSAKIITAKGLSKVGTVVMAAPPVLKTYAEYKRTNGDAGATFRAGLKYGTATVVGYYVGAATTTVVTAAGSSTTLGLGTVPSAALGVSAGIAANIGTQTGLEIGFDYFYNKLGY